MAGDGGVRGRAVLEVVRCFPQPQLVRAGHIELSQEAVKMGYSHTTWKQRLFKLNGTSLRYYKSAKSSSPKGIITLTPFCIAKVWQFLRVCVSVIMRECDYVCMCVRECDYVCMCACVCVSLVVRVCFFLPFFMCLVHGCLATAMQSGGVASTEQQCHCEAGKQPASQRAHQT